MAENETPDIKISMRWIKAIRAIIAGRPQDEVERELRIGLNDSWSATDRQLRRRGHSVHAIVEATLRGDQAYLDQALRDTRGHRFIRMIAGCTTFMQGPGDVLAEAVSGHLDGIRQQIRDLLVTARHCENLGQADDRVSPAFRAVSAETAAFAQRFLASPRRAARLLRPVPAAGAAGSGSGVPAGLIHMSLVNPAALPRGLRP